MCVKMNQNYDINTVYVLLIDISGLIYKDEDQFNLMILLLC